MSKMDWQQAVETIKKKFPKATPVKVVKIISGIYRKKTSD